MKFISKILKICCGNLRHFPVPVFEFTTFQNYKISDFQSYKIHIFKPFSFVFFKCSMLNFQVSRCQMSHFPNFKFQSQFSKFQIPKLQKVRYITISTFSEFLIPRHTNNIFPGYFHIFLHFLKYFW